MFIPSTIITISSQALIYLEGTPAIIAYMTILISLIKIYIKSKLSTATAVLCFILLCFINAKHSLLNWQEQTSHLKLMQRESDSKISSLYFQGTIIEITQKNAGELRLLLSGQLSIKKIQNEVQAQKFLKSNVKFLGYAPDLPWTDYANINCGDTVEGKIRIFYPAIHEQKLNPFSYAGFLSRRGIIAVGSITESQIFKKHSQKSPRLLFVEKFFQQFGTSNALAVLLGITIGERRLFGEEITELFRETGTSHLLVVSGFHVGIVFIFSLNIFKFLYCRSKALCVILPATYPASIFALLVSSFYVWLTGYELTSSRSIFVLSVFVASRLLERKGDPLRTIFLAMIFVLAIWPGAFFDVSFLLTFSAIFGLYFGAKSYRILCRLNPAANEKENPLANHVTARWKNSFHKYFLLPLSLSFGASLFTTPVVLAFFSAANFISVFYNLLFVSVFSYLGIGCGLISLLLFYLNCPLANTLVEIELYLIGEFLHLMKWLNTATNEFGIGYIEFEQDKAFLLAFIIGCIIICSIIVVQIAEKRIRLCTLEKK